MIALRLAATVFELSMGSDMSAVARDDIIERFESLRSYGKLPRGQERRNQQLTNGEIAAAILGLVSPNPKWAGHAACAICVRSEVQMPPSTARRLFRKRLSES
jgi:hypothetical protein